MDSYGCLVPHDLQYRSSSISVDPQWTQYLTGVYDTGEVTSPCLNGDAARADFVNLKKTSHPMATSSIAMLMPAIGSMTTRLRSKTACRITA